MLKCNFLFYLLSFFIFIYRLSIVEQIYFQTDIAYEWFL